MRTDHSISRPGCDLSIQEFDYRSASESKLAALNVCGNRLRAESWPDDPPIDLDETIASLRSIPPFVDLTIWAAWARAADDGEARIVATGRVATFDMPANRHAAELNIGVLPEYRRRGLGSRLLALAADAAAAADRRLLVAMTDSEVPAGDAFMNRIGGSMGLSERVSELDLCQANDAAMSAWLERAPAGEFELGLWKGPYPDEALPVVVAMLEAINLAPRGDLEIEDMVWTPEILRQRDAALVQRGVERWTLYARHRETGAIAGYTQAYWNPERPEILQQGDTAVFPDYRNRGLARWLKAAMLEKVRRDRPEVTRVRADNAHSNAAMLRINEAMGFIALKAWNIWQVPVVAAQAYAAGCRYSASAS